MVKERLELPTEQHVMIDNVVELNREVHTLQKRMKLNNKRRRLESKRHQNSIALLQKEISLLSAEVWRRRGRDACSAFEGCGVAIMRCVSNTSSKRLCIVMRKDVAHTTVNKWEMVTDASLVAASRAWHKEDDALLELEDGAPAAPDESAPEIVEASLPKRIWKWHHIRCDATNAMVWQRCKLFTLEVKSSKMMDQDRAGLGCSELGVLPHQELHTRLGDLQEVSDGTGLHDSRKKKAKKRNKQKLDNAK